jgi:hypothetical protein
MGWHLAETDPRWLARVQRGLTALRVVAYTMIGAVESGAPERAAPHHTTTT